MLDAWLTQRADAEAAERNNWAHFPGELPPGLQLQWLGTAGFRLSYLGTTLLIDPYLSRISLANMLRRRQLASDPACVSRYLSAVDAVVVGHTHFDHALDVPLIARSHDCRVFGSRSLGQLMRIFGQASQSVEVVAYAPYRVGPFEFAFVPSLHARLLLGVAVPAAGEITAERAEDLNAATLRSGQVYGIRISVAGRTFFHLGSAELAETFVPPIEVDYALVAIVGRRFSRDFVPRLLRALRPQFIVAHHYDDLFRPLEAPQRFLRGVDLAGFVAELRQVSRAQPRTMHPLQVVGV